MFYLFVTPDPESGITIPLLALGLGYSFTGIHESYRSVSRCASARFPPSRDTVVFIGMLFLSHYMALGTAQRKPFSVVYVLSLAKVLSTTFLFSLWSVSRTNRAHRPLCLDDPERANSFEV